MKLTPSTAAALALLCATVSSTSADQVYGHSPYNGMHRRHNAAEGQHRPRHAAAPIDSSAKMIKRTKRDPLFYTGAIPVLDMGVAPIVGLVQTNKHDLAERDGQTMYDHNGQQGVAVFAAFTTSNNDDDEEDCDDDDEDDADDDDGEDCDADDDNAEEDDEDCDDEDDDTSSSSSNGSASATVSSSKPTSTSNGSNGAESNVVQEVKAPAPSSSSTSANTLFGARPAAAPSSSSSTSAKATATPSAQPKDTSAAFKIAKSSVFSGGQATWFTQNGNAGACGKKNPDSAMLVALPTKLYDNGKNCGRTIEIHNLQDNTFVTATVADECPSCEGANSLDLSVGAMSAIDKNYVNDGVRKIEWVFTS